jgi:hypothetical protein
VAVEEACDKVIFIVVLDVICLFGRAARWKLQRDEAGE